MERTFERLFYVICGLRVTWLGLPLFSYYEAKERGLCFSNSIITFISVYEMAYIHLQAIPESGLS